jgi:hypothetical protein
MSAVPTAMILLAVSAFILTLVSAAGKVPTWVAVLIISLFCCLAVLPK